MKSAFRIPTGRDYPIAENDTITTRAKLDARGRVQLREEDRIFLGIVPGDLLEITVKKAKLPSNPR